MKKILIASTMAAVSLLGTAGLARAATPVAAAEPCGAPIYPLCESQAPVPPLTVPPTAPPVVTPLPVTGSNSNQALLAGAGVLGTGGGLVLVARRRRRPNNAAA